MWLTKRMVNEKRTKMKNKQKNIRLSCVGRTEKKKEKTL